MTGSEALGRALGVGIPLSLMAWAAVETDHLVLRIALMAWIVLTVGLQIAAAGGWRPEAKEATK